MKVCGTKSPNARYKVICLNCTEKGVSNTETACHIQLTISCRRMTSVPGRSEDTAGWMLHVPTMATSQLLPKQSSNQLAVKTKNNTTEWADGCYGSLQRWFLSRKKPVLGSKSYLQKLSRYTHSGYWKYNRYILHSTILALLQS